MKSYYRYLFIIGLLVIPVSNTAESRTKVWRREYFSCAGQIIYFLFLHMHACVITGLSSYDHTELPPRKIILRSFGSFLTLMSGRGGSR